MIDKKEVSRLECWALVCKGDLSFEIFERWFYSSQESF